jgi:hypothetical protein
VFLASVIKHARRMRRVILPSAASLALQNFFHLISLTKQFLEKELVKENMCFDFFYNFV